MFDIELQYFIDHQDELVAQHKGRILVLQDKRVVETHPTLMEAYAHIKQAGLLGKVMLQHCEPGEQAYTVYIGATGFVS